MSLKAYTIIDDFAFKSNDGVYSPKSFEYMSVDELSPNETDEVPHISEIAYSDQQAKQTNMSHLSLENNCRCNHDQNRAANKILASELPCKTVYSHINNCQLCSMIVKNQMRFYQVIIAGLLLLILFMYFSHKKHLRQR